MVRVMAALVFGLMTSKRTVSGGRRALVTTQYV
jgi:hypothetical protein